MIGVEWLPSLISVLALGVIFYYIKNIAKTLRDDIESRVVMAEKKVDIISERLTIDEKDYLTKESHDQICSGNSAKLMLHMNSLMDKQRKENENNFSQLWEYLRELRELIKNGHK